MFFRNGTHLVDAVCFFVDADPEWVSGELDDEHRQYGPRYAGDGGRDPATDPGGTAVVHFANGVRACISASKGTMYNFEIDLIGESGRIRIGAYVAEMWHVLSDGRPAVRQLRPPHTTRGDMVAAIEELIALVEHGGTGSSTGEDGRRALSILLGVLQSNAMSGGRVTFPIDDR